ncbi:MAG: hypothetical protein EPO08_06465 [Rhodospirillaceae bacterium]|nr:MAG: hypothetical protein EPO08_06465 [Rhodospirillaceae bacterium]
MTRDELISRLGNTESSSKELDFWCWWYGKSTEADKPNPMPPPEDYVESNLMSHANSFAPTLSVDAALRMVPENARVRELGQWWDMDHPGGWFCNVMQWERDKNLNLIERCYVYGFSDSDIRMPILAPTAAIAICIAALKARRGRSDKG